jgi:cbb3-type cytochrome oxidase cytochrome c subunit
MKNRLFFKFKFVKIIREGTQIYSKNNCFLCFTQRMQSLFALQEDHGGSDTNQE